MPKKDKVSTMGYSVGSPYRGRPFIDINTPEGLIDMSNTDIPLMGMDETGMQKMMMPHSGMHKFRGRKVREVPMQQGGINTQQIVEWLFEGDDEEDAPKAPSAAEVGTEEREQFEQEKAMFAMQQQEFEDEQGYNVGLSIAMQDRNLSQFYRPSGASRYQGNMQNGSPAGAGQYGKQIIADVTGALGYTPQFNSVGRTPEKQAELVRQGVGVKDSWHLTGDAVDMKPEDWKKMSPEKQQQIRNQYDVVYHNNHYHIEPKGKKALGGKYRPKY